MQLENLLIQKKDVLLKEWFNQVVETYPEETLKFFKKLKDDFSNPVGTNIYRGLEAILQELFQGMDHETLKSFLDPIIRIRAVQGFTPSEAVSFIFDLKSVIRRAMSKEILSKQSEELLAFESKIDVVGLISFDIYMSCREKIYELKANEIKNRTFRALKKANLITEDQADG